MPRQKTLKAHKHIDLESYNHSDKTRVNNPPVGLVTTQTDKTIGKIEYQFDPHIDPQLQWAGKAERSNFSVPNVSLHVHERIDAKTIAKSFIKTQDQVYQPSLFDAVKNVPLSKAVNFYSHEESWANRLIAGDSLLVMNSLLYKEAMAGKVQMIYIDPPYGIKYNSNFQPFTNKRDVKDGNDSSIPADPEMIKAFRDTWELGIHSYLTYLRERLLLAKELLDERGSCFVQISEENVHFVKQLMSEIFGPTNFINLISYRTTSGLPENFLNVTNDFIIWFAKDREQLKKKYKQLYKQRDQIAAERYDRVELENGTAIKLSIATDDQIKRGRLFSSQALMSAGYTESCTFDFEFDGRIFHPQRGKSWKTNRKGMEELANKNRLIIDGNTLRYKRYADDFPVIAIDTLWTDTWGEQNKNYVVQTGTTVLERCMLMCTDPGDLVLDPTCGGGTTAFIAEQWGRRWVTCDTSRVAITLTKQRLMTAQYNFYQLAHPQEGVKSGFKYKLIPHVTLASIANKELPVTEVLYDQPLIEKDTVRCAGPFTLEAVPSIRTAPFDGNYPNSLSISDLAKSGVTAFYQYWIDELKTTGIRAVGGRIIEFARIGHKEGSPYIHAEGEINEDGQLRKANVVFAEDYGPLEQRSVELALKATMEEKDRPTYLIFAAFQFDPEAAKDIDMIDIPGLTVLKAQMNIDLLTEDLRKKRSSNQSYWLIGQPSIEVTKDQKGLFQVKVRGFDYYNPATGETESGGIKQVALWQLDTDYDERAMVPTQVFFPNGDDKKGWTKLAKALNGTVDEDLLEFFSSDTSLPFRAGNNRKIAVKIIDNRGVESLVIKELK